MRLIGSSRRQCPQHRETRRGYRRGLRTGANLCTINLTPESVRSDYLLYKRDRFIMNEARIRGPRSRGSPPVFDQSRRAFPSRVRHDAGVTRYPDQPRTEIPVVEPISPAGVSALKPERHPSRTSSAIQLPRALRMAGPVSRPAGIPFNKTGDGDWPFQRFPVPDGHAMAANRRLAQSHDPVRNFARRKTEDRLTQGLHPRWRLGHHPDVVHREVEAKPDPDQFEIPSRSYLSGRSHRTNAHNSS